MQRDWPDIFGGLILAAIGACAVIWAALYYDMGTLRRMGPGFFPVVLGAALFLMGVIVAFPALGRPGAAPKIEFASAVAVLAATLIFAFGLSRLGLAGATAAAVLVATIPAPRKGWVWRILLAAIITVLTVLIFSIGLRMTLPLWPRLS